MVQGMVALKIWSKEWLDYKYGSRNGWIINMAQGEWSIYKYGPRKIVEL